MPLLSASQEPIEFATSEHGELTAPARSELCSDCFAAPEAGPIDQLCRKTALGWLRSIDEGGLTIRDCAGAQNCGACSSDSPTITVHSQSFWRSLVLGGRLAAEEAYLRGDWDCDDLLGMMRVLGKNANTLRCIDTGVSRLLGPLKRLQNWRQRNTKDGSRRNIAAHYDLSNDFFQLMLDPTMAYSSGVFASPESTLEEASIEKFDRICRKLRLTPEDHLLEIGCGWGGLSMHAAQQFGCRVTATTISRQQYKFAKDAIERAGLEDRITLVSQDYRDLRGQFDKLVSVEMIEAVGERYLNDYFVNCNSLLKPGGLMLLQAITMEEQSYGEYRRSRDFIQEYIFPGGFLPSLSSIFTAIARIGTLQPMHLEDFGLDYARTLELWRERFWANIESVRDLGFDERFIRMWDYYLCYSQTGFEQQTTGLSQLLFAKAVSR